MTDQPTLLLQTKLPLQSLHTLLLCDFLIWSRAQQPGRNGSTSCGCSAVKLLVWADREEATYLDIYQLRLSIKPVKLTTSFLRSCLLVTTVGQLFSFVHVINQLLCCVLFGFVFFFVFFKGWMEREPCHIHDRVEEPPSNWTHNYWPILEERF